MAVFTMVSTAKKGKKTMEFSIFVFVRAQETNLPGSKWDGDCIFL